MPGVLRCGAGKGSSASSIPRQINSIFSIFLVGAQNSIISKSALLSHILDKNKVFLCHYYWREIFFTFFFVFKAIKLEVNVSEGCPCSGNYKERHHRSQSQVMGAGARCWLSCLPGKFRSITLKLNSNTESACLSSGPGASQHSINLTFNRPQNSYKQFKQTGISTPGSFWQPHVKVCLMFI